MKRKNNNHKRTHEYFTAKCMVDGKIQLSLELPLHLLDNFQSCFENSEKMKILTMLYEEYSQLTPFHKEVFQMSIFENADRIISMADLICMMHAMVKVIPAE